MLNAYQLNLEVTMNDMTETMIETMKKNILQCFNQLREDDSILEPSFSLGYLLPDIVKDKFKYTIFDKDQCSD